MSFLCDIIDQEKRGKNMVADLLIVDSRLEPRQKTRKLWHRIYRKKPKQIVRIFRMSENDTYGFSLPEIILDSKHPIFNFSVFIEGYREREIDYGVYTRRCAIEWLYRVRQVQNLYTFSEAAYNNCIRTVLDARCRLIYCSFCWKWKPCIDRYFPPCIAPPESPLPQCCRESRCPPLHEHRLDQFQFDFIHEGALKTTVMPIQTLIDMLVRQCSTQFRKKITRICLECLRLFYYAQCMNLSYGVFTVRNPEPLY